MKASSLTHRSPLSSVLLTSCRLEGKTLNELFYHWIIIIIIIIINIITVTAIIITPYLLHDTAFFEGPWPNEGFFSSWIQLHFFPLEAEWWVTELHFD